MKTTLILMGLMAAGSAAAHAMPVEIDSRTVTENGVTAQLVRLQDTSASGGECANYGTLTVSKDGQVLDQKSMCGATNLLAAVQGTQPVFYVYAQDMQGLNLYRYIPERRELAMFAFHANGLKITSLGNDVMVQAYFPEQTGTGIIQRRDGWVWRYNYPAPKPIK